MKIEKITFNQNRDHSPLKKNLVLILGLDWRPFQKKRMAAESISICIQIDFATYRKVR